MYLFKYQISILMDTKQVYPLFQCGIDPYSIITNVILSNFLDE